ncbi:MAG: metallophosphoesterase family protein [Alphaproteobacteria bacterium]
MGDVHGECRLLEALLEEIGRDAAGLGATPRRTVVFLGDYVDRGPDSRGVVDLLLQRPLNGAEHRFLLGNHEQAMLDFLRDPEAGAGWLAYGGIMTADSYGVRAALPASPASRAAFRDALAAAMPPAHLAFLEALEPSATYGDYAFAHAGVRPGLSLDDQHPDDLLWIREPFLNWTGSFGKRIVHGHTIRPAPEVLPNRIGIDTGAYATGVLTAVALSGSQVRILQARR